MKAAVSVAVLGAIAGLATGQTVIEFDNLAVDGAVPNTFTVLQEDSGPLLGFTWDLGYDTVPNSWGSEINITLTHVDSGFTFSFDGSDANFADFGPDDVLFGWGDSAGLFASVGAQEVSNGPAETIGVWTITVTDEFDDNADQGGLDGILNGTITINKVPAPAGLALLGMGGLLTGRRRR